MADCLNEAFPTLCEGRDINSLSQSVTSNFSLKDDFNHERTRDEIEGLQRADSKNYVSYFCESRHEILELKDLTAQGESIFSQWKHKDRLKTTAVALVMCLNIGVDPPDVMKISPCAKLECWIDPLSMQPPKALDAIGKNLQAQYERWQQRAKYRIHLDPTTEDAKKLVLACRRNARNERLLFHYNGHGVPKPTPNGEIWVFNKVYTQYIPLSLFDLHSWVGRPCIYVFDCSAAGLVLKSLKQFPNVPTKDAYGRVAPSTLDDFLFLGACGADELLPQYPDLPADVFTACLTTPIKMALRWFCSRSLLFKEGVIKDLIDRIPGKQTDRKTPLGELNWIFTAVTDSIAWNTLPRPLFQKLFRQDLLVASLFRNFLLADRIMRSTNCTPVSYPRLPPTHQHPMWQAWDMAAEAALSQLPGLLSSDGAIPYVPSSFFFEQLKAFELWISHGKRDRSPPEQLPIILQVLLSQVHRLEALRLFASFLDMGSWAVDLAFSVGIFPCVLKLLQTTAIELQETLIFIWAKFLALDPSCQDLIKDNVHMYFINCLSKGDEKKCKTNAQAAFVLATICSYCPKGQSVCAQSNLLEILIDLLRLPKHKASPDKNIYSSDTGLMIKWLCLCFGKLVKDDLNLVSSAIQHGGLNLMADLTFVENPELRGAALFALYCMLVNVNNDINKDSKPSPAEIVSAASDFIVSHLLLRIHDGSPIVRAEAAIGLGKIINCNEFLFKGSIVEMQNENQRKTLTDTSLEKFTKVVTLERHHLSSDPNLNMLDDETTEDTIFMELNALCSLQISDVKLQNYVLKALCMLGNDPFPHVAKIAQSFLKPLGLYLESNSFDQQDDLRTRMSSSKSIGNLSQLNKSKSAAMSFLNSSSSTVNLVGAAATGITNASSRWLSVNLLRSSSKYSASTNITADSNSAELKDKAGINVNQVSENPTESTFDRTRSLQLPSSIVACDTFEPSQSKADVIESPSFYVARKYFSEHSEDKMVTEWIGRGYCPSYGCLHKSIRAQCHPGRVDLRLSESIAVQNKLRQIESLNTESTGSMCFLPHPFRSVMTMVDSLGVARVFSAKKPFTLKNSFSILHGDLESHLKNSVSRQTSCVKSIWHINEYFSGMLLAGFANGTVGVWRDYGFSKAQRLATSWQSMPCCEISKQMNENRKVCYDWQSTSGALFVASGLKISPIYKWDVLRELCTQQITPTEALNGEINYLSSSKSNHNLLAAASSNTVCLFDLRSSSKPMCSTGLKVNKSLVNIVLEPGAQENTLVTAADNGLLNFFDLRLTSTDASTSIYKSVQDHSKAPMTAMTAHPNAPLIATGTSTQVIKLWSTSGHAQGVIRTQVSLLNSRGKSIDSLHFHPFKLQLTATSCGSITMYPIEFEGLC